MPFSGTSKMGNRGANRIAQVATVCLQSGNYRREIRAVRRGETARARSSAGKARDCHSHREHGMIHLPGII